MSAKGTSWSKHKYIRIENGRYIYSEGQSKNGSSSGISYGKGTSGDRAATASEISKLLKNFKLTKGKGGSSSKKASSEKKGSAGKAEKESSKKSKDEKEEKKLIEKKDQPKITVNEEYTKILEEFRNKNENKSQLKKVYDHAEKEEDKKKKLKHYFSAENQFKPDLDSFFL